jgi:hypothetical protein
MSLASAIESKPYRATFIRKNLGYTIIYDGTEIFVLPVSLGIDAIGHVVSALNGAYVEGYLQKEREIQAEQETS